jgi:hypothetical protein
MLDPPNVIYDLVALPLLWYYLASNFPEGRMPAAYRQRRQRPERAGLRPPHEVYL